MRNLSLLLTLITIAQPLLCMDQTEPILDIMLSNITYLSHDDIHSLALVNNNYNKIVKQTNNIRKEYVTKHALDDPSFIKAPVTWHKNGAAYTYAAVELSTNKRTFKLVYLGDNGVQQEATYNNFNAGALPYPNNNHYHATFNGQGDAYFYLIDWVKSTSGSYTSIIEYRLNTKKTIAINRCLIDLNDQHKEHISCIGLIHFPTLLQAFLQSTQMYEQATPSFSILQSSDNNNEVKECAVNAKIYNIKGVTIPNDYNVCKENQNVGIPFKSFNNYSTDVRINRIQKAVIKKYNEQLSKKIEKK